MDEIRRNVGLIALVALVVIITFLIFMDITLLLSGELDLNRHIPFMLPGVLCLFLGINIWMRRIESTLTPEQYAKIRVDLPYDVVTHRADPGRFE